MSDEFFSYVYVVEFIKYRMFSFIFFLLYFIIHTIIFKCERMDSNVLYKKKYIENRYIILASPLP